MTITTGDMPLVTNDLTILDYVTVAYDRSKSALDISRNLTAFITPIATTVARNAARAQMDLVLGNRIPSQVADLTSNMFDTAAARTSLPLTSGVVWNDNGVVSVS